MVTSTSFAGTYAIQVAEGEFADLAAKVTANDYTMFPYTAPTQNNDAGISEVMQGRYLSGSKLWGSVDSLFIITPLSCVLQFLHQFPILLQIEVHVFRKCN